MERAQEEEREVGEQEVLSEEEVQAESAGGESMVFRPMTPEELRRDPVLEELARAVDPIRGLVQNIRYYRSEGGEARSVQVGFGSGDALVGAMVTGDRLILDIPAGEVPATAEVYASLLAQNKEGPWWYRVDGVDDSTAVVVRVCYTQRSRVAELDQLMASGWRDYFKVQAMLGVLNGNFDVRR